MIKYTVFEQLKTTEKLSKKQKLKRQFCCLQISTYLAVNLTRSPRANLWAIAYFPIMRTEKTAQETRLKSGS